MGFFVEFNSNDTIRIESKNAEKGKLVETLDDTSFSILNEMVNPVDEITSEWEIDELYESVENFLKANKEEIENLDLRNIFNKLEENITAYARLQGSHKKRILARFLKYILMLKEKYGASLKCSKSSICLLTIFTSRRYYDLYKKDLRDGQIGEQIKELLLYPPFLDSFGLKADDLVISLNDRELTQEKGKEEVHVAIQICSSDIQGARIVFLLINIIFLYYVISCFSSYITIVDMCCSLY